MVHVHSTSCRYQYLYRCCTCSGQTRLSLQPIARLLAQGLLACRTQTAASAHMHVVECLLNMLKTEPK
jgi:hypothetical protein